MPIGPILVTMLSVYLAAAPPQDVSAAGAPEVRIVSPRRDEYVVGRFTIQVEVSSAERIRQVAVSVDGETACALAAPPYTCEVDAGPRAVEHQIRVVAVPANGPRGIATLRTRGLAVSDIVDVDIVEVTATVGDEGHYVTGLQRDDFVVYEDDRQQTITQFDAEHVPLDLTVAVDISESLTDAMPRMKQALQALLAAIPQDARVRLLTFNNDVVTLSPPTATPAERRAAVARIAPSGATAFYDAILRGTERVGPRIGRRVMIVFTDGEDQGSHARLDDVEARLQASDMTLYIVAQGRGKSLASLKNVMTRLAAPTGGRALFTDHISQLEATFARIVDELSYQYLLRYAPTNMQRDGTYRRIRVDVQGHDHVRARQGYRAPYGDER